MTHPAILKAQSLYDECSGEEMEPNQEVLVAAVNRINDRKANAYGAAQRVWGDIPLKYRACLIFADAVANSELTAALEAYELSLEYLDEVEEIAFAMAKLTLEEWRRQVGDHLQFIEAGAQMAAGRARRLPGRHEWETKAEDELSKARKALEAALANIIAAQETYASKPVLEHA